MDFEDLFASIRQPKIEQKPWMKSKRMELVTPETISRVVDECIASGRYSLDLETTGLDTTVFDGRTKDTIVGFCVSPDGNVGYYIPVMHPGHESSCVPQSLAYSEMRRLANSAAIAIFHNARFDQEFLEFCGGEPIGNWDDIKKWDDTIILAYLRNSKERKKGLKTLAKNELGMEMIELKDLFSYDDLKKHGKNFSRLDPAWPPTLWYATSDAICTYLLYDKLYSEAIDPREVNGQTLPSQRYVYIIEKGQVAATRWMMRIGIPIDRDKVCELIRIGQREWLPSLTGFYDEASRMLGRDVLPGYVKILSDPTSPYYFDTEEVGVEIMDKVRQAREEAARRRMDPVQAAGSGKVKFQTIPKAVSKIGQESGTEIVEFPVVYDVLIPEQLGLALRELGVPGLKTTEKSGQVSTSKKDIDLLLSSLGDEFAYVKKFKRFREVAKALSSNLMPLYDGTDKNKGRSSRVRINFDGFKTDTARFSTPAPEDADVSDQDWIGLVPWNLHSSPTFSSERPECMARIREVIRAEPEYFIVAIDYSGQELRVVSNLSGEPVWITEFFRCSGCGHAFDRGGPTPPPPPAPPPFCPTCGSDKIGDIHSTTAIASFGESIKNDPDTFKEHRKLAKCVHPDTLIRTPEGLRRIGSLLTGQEDTFYPVQEISVTGPDGSAVPVLETYNGGVKELYHVVTRRGVVTCSAQHRFKLADGSLMSISDGLIPGSLLSCQKPQKKLRRKTSAGAAPRHDELEDRAYLSGLNQGEVNPRIPDWVLDAGSTLLRAYLGGLLDARGVVSRPGDVTLTLGDMIFTGQVAEALRLAGCRPHVRIAAGAAHELIVTIVLDPRDNGLLRPFMRNPDKVSRIGDRPHGRLWERNYVLHVLPAGEHACVDLHLASEDHLYVGNGLVMHNSINFGLCYGGGANVIVNAAKVSKEEGWRIKRQFDETYQTLSAWWEAIREYGRKTGFVLSGFNRRYPIPDLLHEEGWIRAQAERNAVNSPVQASGSDIMKNAMSLIFRELKARGWLDLVRMIITIHDELVFEIHGSILAEAVEVLQELMLKKALARMKWRVPLTCDTEIGFDWTVPWNLTYIKYGKKPIPPELKDVLKPDFVLSKSDIPVTKPTCILVVPELSVDQLIRVYATRLKYAGTGKGSLVVEHEEKVVVEDHDANVDPVAAKTYFTSLNVGEAAMSLAQPAERQVQVPKLAPGVPMTIRLLGEPDLLTPVRVASAIAKCRGRGNHGVRVVDRDGAVLVEDLTAMVMPQELMLYVADYAELVT